MAPPKNWRNPPSKKDDKSMETLTLSDNYNAKKAKIRGLEERLENC